MNMLQRIDHNFVACSDGGVDALTGDVALSLVVS
jgi:hypothetical protein